MITHTNVFRGSPVLISSTEANLEGSCCMVLPRHSLEEWARTRDPRLLEYRHALHAMLQLCTACGCYYPPEEYAGRDFHGPHFKDERSVCTACTFDGGGWHK